MVCSSVLPGCPAVAHGQWFTRNWPLLSQHKSSSAFRNPKGPRQCSVNMVSLGRIWLRSTTGLNAGSWRKYECRSVAKKCGKFREESWFFVFSAKGPVGFRWWHSTLLQQQHLWAGCWGDLLSLIHPEPPQVKGMSDALEPNKTVAKCALKNFLRSSWFTLIYLYIGIPVN